MNQIEGNLPVESLWVERSFIKQTERSDFAIVAYLAVVAFSYNGGRAATTAESDTSTLVRQFLGQVRSLSTLDHSTLLHYFQSNAYYLGPPQEGIYDGLKRPCLLY